MKENKDKKLSEEQIEENEQLIRPMRHEGHSLKTRRDFLAQGFLGMTAFALAPTALSLLSGSAEAQVTGCVSPVRSGMTPVIIIDLAGGGSIAGSNVMVGGAGGQKDYLASYNSLGLPPDFHPNLKGVNEEMGLAFHPDSGILRGIQSLASTTTRANVDGTIFCSTSDDDTGNNQSNPMYWLAKAGAVGELRPLAGTNQTDSGGNSMSPAASINPSVAPVRIASNQDAINLVSLGNRFNEFASNAGSKGIIESAARMSNKKLEMIERRSLPEKIRQLISCSFNQTNEQIEKFTANAVSADTDTNATTVFNRITNTGVRNRSKPIVKLVLDGYIGAGTIVLGGYDYHDGTRALGDVRDFELGQLIGAIMELASIKQKDVVIYVLTDGGVAAQETVDNTVNGGGKFIWTGDSGQRSATLMMVYKKDGRPFLRKSNRQVGYYKANGSVEGAALLTSNSVINTSKAMVANYLALHGKEGTLESVIGDDPFKASLDRYLVFDKLR